MQRGRPIRGAIAGLLFGLFVGLDLVIFGVVALDSNLLVVLPVLGLAGGIALGLTTPLRRRTGAAPVEPEADEPERVPYADISDDRPFVTHLVAPVPDEPAVAANAELGPDSA